LRAGDVIRCDTTPATGSKQRLKVRIELLGNPLTQSVPQPVVLASFPSPYLEVTRRRVRHVSHVVWQRPVTTLNLVPEERRVISVQTPDSHHHHHRHRRVERHRGARPTSRGELGLVTCPRFTSLTSLNAHGIIPELRAFEQQKGNRKNRIEQCQKALYSEPSLKLVIAVSNLIPIPIPGKQALISFFLILSHSHTGGTEAHRRHRGTQAPAEHRAYLYRT
jgi:hypothetical protein